MLNYPLNKCTMSFSLNLDIISTLLRHCITRIRENLSIPAGFYVPTCKQNIKLHKNVFGKIFEIELSSVVVDKR